VLSFLLLPTVVRAQAKPIATVETNINATAELYECRRKTGVLTVKVRLKATGKVDEWLYFRETYIMDVGSGKKYEVLKDSDGNAIATTSPSYKDRITVQIAPGGSFNLWWKFPAPPPETKTITFSMPGAEPFEDVPITDAP
jgi:hypothetical protein